MSETNGLPVRTLNSTDADRLQAQQLRLMLAVNNSGLADQMLAAKKAVFDKVMNSLAPFTTPKDEILSPQEAKQREVNQLKFMLNQVGPAAASAIIDQTVSSCRSVLKYNYASGSSFVTTFNAIVNNEDDLTQFGGSLREMLLPRYSYLDFDSLVDPRHMIDRECGYPRAISPSMYKFMYDRDDIASRVNDIYADECWAYSPDVYENPEEDKPLTGFEQDWAALKEYYNIESVLYRMDKLAGIGHFGALLIGLDDGKDLSEPVSSIDEWGRYNSNPRYGATRNNRVLYFRPFDEYLSYVMQYDTDVNSPRYGQPIMYNMIFVDMTVNQAGTSVGTRLNKRVHWTRVVHVIEPDGTSPVFHMPRQQQVFNRLLDLRKIKGAAAEAMWKGGFPGIAFEVDPQFVADDPLFDREEFKTTIQAFANGMQRYIDLIGIKANTLSSNIATNPEKYVDMHMQAISANKGIPYRIFIGSEEAKLAASQDRLAWNIRLGRKLKRFVEPFLIRTTINRLIAMRVMRPPADGKYFVDWEDLNTPTDEDSANLSLKYSQAMSQYVASGMIHLIKPLDYFTVILRLKPSVAVRLDQQMQADGGYTKLLKVDPAEQANPGANGTKSSPASASPT